MTDFNASTEEFNEKAAFEAFKEKVDNMTIDERKEYYKKMGLKIDIENK